MPDLDLVYIVRPGDDNEPLRFSLRSLVNLPHRSVWIVGHKPAWVTDDVHHVPGNRGHSKPQNVFDNVRIACSIPDLGDQIVLMNDDFFVMRPVTHLELWWRFPLRDHIASIRSWSSWKQSLIATLDLLEQWGHPDPVSYELHVPLLTDRHVMADVLARASGFSPLYPPQWRTLYGNTVGGGAQMIDVKVRAGHRWDPESQFLSCYAASFAGPLGEHLAATFPAPSPYEREGATHADDRAPGHPVPA